MLRAPTHIVELGTTTKRRTTAAAAAAAATTTTTTTRQIRRDSTTTTTIAIEDKTSDSTVTAISFMQRWHIGKSATTKAKTPKATIAKKTSTTTTAIDNIDKSDEQRQQTTTITPIVEKFYNERTSLYEKQRNLQQTNTAAAAATTTTTTQKSLPIFMREHLTTKILLLTTPFSFKKTKKQKNITAIATTETATTIDVDELKIPKVTIQQEQQQQSCCNHFDNVTYPKHKKPIKEVELQPQQQQEQQQQQQQLLHQTQQPKSRAASIVDIEIEKISRFASNGQQLSATYPTGKNDTDEPFNNNLIINNNNNNNSLSFNNKNKNKNKDDFHNKCNYNNKNDSIVDTVSDSGSVSGSGSGSNSGSGSDFYNFKSQSSSQSTSSASYSTASSLSLSTSSYGANQLKSITPPKILFNQKFKTEISTTPPITNTLKKSTTTATTTTSTSTSATTSLNVVPTTRMSPTSQTPTRTSLFDSCHRKIRLISGGPVAFLGGLVAKARRKERDGDQNSTDTKLYLEESVLERKLPEADLKALVDLPAGLDYNEWLASHTLALFEHVNLVYGTISEFCTPPGCPDMTGPGNRTYLWFDEKGKKTRVAAPQYIDYVMTFTQKTVSDESIFPTKYANEFPSSFESIARKILRLQFHVIAHLYAAHFREIALLGLHTHLNLTFAHLTALHRRFNLIDEKETDVLRDLEVALRLTDDSSGSGNGNGNGNGSCSGHSNSNSNNTQASSETASMVTASSIAANSMGSSELQIGGAAKNTNSPSNNATTPATLATSAIATGSAAAAAAAATTTATASTTVSTKQCYTAGGHQKTIASSTTRDDVNTSAATTSIDGDARIRPICTQPEAASKPAVFGGGDNLIGGILGDLSSGEFVDTTRYCTSAILPMSSVSNSNFTDDGGGCGAASASAAGGVGGVGGLNSNNGIAATLHLNFNNNHHNHNLHYHHHHHVHHLFQQQQHLQQHHHQHQHQHQQHPFPHPHQQNTGLIQCNASNAPSVNATAVSVATAAANAAANSTASTTAA